jgi:hypothetical protein
MTPSLGVMGMTRLMVGLELTFLKAEMAMTLSLVVMALIH